MRVKKSRTSKYSTR